MFHAQRAKIVCVCVCVLVTLGHACASGQFTESGQCCSLCPAGFGVAVDCGKEDTKCSPCPQGTFSSSEGLNSCQPCASCPSSVPMLASCTTTQDTHCECDNDFFFWGAQGLCAPCSKCARGQGVVRECGPPGDTLCQICGPGTFSEELRSSKPCQTCTKCSDSEVEIRACMPNSDTLCMGELTEGIITSAPGTPKFSPQDEGGSTNILAYVSVLAAVVLGLLLYVAYKCWRSCKQKKALSKARAAELGTSPEGEKLQSDSGVFLDSHSLQDNQSSKGVQDNRLYVNLPPHRQEEVERLLQEGDGQGWRQLGAALGYEPEQLDLFGRGEAAAHTLLSNWAQKDGSTLGLLCSALARVERADVVTALNCPAQGVSVV
uniref:Uncharacterized protein n=1 Tax=Mola mola TaxID=94237 RepID=A0A3Q3VNK8_MOLML